MHYPEKWHCPHCNRLVEHKAECPHCHWPNYYHYPEKWHCPNCHEDVLHSRTCPKCKYPENLHYPEAWHCPNCNRLVKHKVKCPYCEQESKGFEFKLPKIPRIPRKFLKIVFLAVPIIITLIVFSAYASVAYSFSDININSIYLSTDVINMPFTASISSSGMITDVEFVFLNPDNETIVFNGVYDSGNWVMNESFVFDKTGDWSLRVLAEGVNIRVFKEREFKVFLGCSNDTDCSYDEYCYTGRCLEVECSGCRYIEDHECYDYECCESIDCGVNTCNNFMLNEFLCINHSCSNKTRAVSCCSNLDCGNYSCSDNYFGWPVCDDLKHTCSIKMHADVECCSDSDCNDENPCTSDHCNLTVLSLPSCYYENITECGLLDGCCPAGCLQFNDPDCVTPCLVDSQCGDDQYCTNNLVCAYLVCGECEYAGGHACHAYECCESIDCGVDYCKNNVSTSFYCVEHECVEDNETVSCCNDDDCSSFEYCENETSFSCYCRTGFWSYCDTEIECLSAGGDWCLTACSLNCPSPYITVSVYDYNSSATYNGINISRALTAGDGVFYRFNESSYEKEFELLNKTPDVLVNYLFFNSSSQFNDYEDEIPETIDFIGLMSDSRLENSETSLDQFCGYVLGEGFECVWNPGLDIFNWFIGTSFINDEFSDVIIQSSNPEIIISNYYLITQQLEDLELVIQNSCSSSVNELVNNITQTNPFRVFLSNYTAVDVLRIIDGLR